MIKIILFLVVLWILSKIRIRNKNYVSWNDRYGGAN